MNFEKRTYGFIFRGEVYQPPLELSWLRCFLAVAGFSTQVPVPVLRHRPPPQYMNAKGRDFLVRDYEISLILLWNARLRIAGLALQTMLLPVFATHRSQPAWPRGRCVPPAAKIADLYNNVSI